MDLRPAPWEEIYSWYSNLGPKPGKDSRRPMREFTTDVLLNGHAIKVLSKHIYLYTQLDTILT